MQAELDYLRAAIKDAKIRGSAGFCQVVGCQQYQQVAETLRNEGYDIQVVTHHATYPKYEDGWMVGYETGKWLCYEVTI